MSQMDDSQVDPQLLSGKVIESDLQNSNWNASGKKRPRPEESPSRSEHRQKLGPPEKSSSILSKRALRSHDQYRRPAVQNDPGELSRPTQEALEHVRNGQSLARKEGAIYDFEDDDQPKSNKTTSATMTKKTGRKAKQASGKRGRPKENKSYVSSTRQRSEKSRAATKTSKSTPQEPSSPGEGSYQESVQVVSSEEEEEAEDAEMQKSGRTNLTRGHPDSGSDANPALFGEHEQWTRILNSAKENTSEAEFMEFVTTGKGLTGLSKTLIANTRKAIEFYKTSRDDGNSTHPHLQEGEDIHKPMRLIEWAVEKFPMLDVDIDASEHDQGKSRKAITSLHQWIIPGLVYLLVSHPSTVLCSKAFELFALLRPLTCMTVDFRVLACLLVMTLRPRAMITMGSMRSSTSSTILTSFVMPRSLGF